MGRLHKCRVFPEIQVARIEQAGGNLWEGGVEGDLPDPAIMPPGCDIIEEEAGLG
tara:strand:+ start:430 stop:594 length:165 start_codon:yes stop_codon:yes gene_type:complete